MLSADAIFAGIVTVGLAGAAGGWRLSALLSKIVNRLDNQDEKVRSIGDVVHNAALLNGKGDALVRDVRLISTDLRTHIANSDTTHAAMWKAITDNDN